MRSEALLTVIVALILPSAAIAAELDGYELWRRKKIDICQDLPTLEEVKCIETNGGTIPPKGFCAVDFDAEINKCVQEQAFADLIALWVDDFVLPAENPTRGEAIGWIQPADKDYDTGTLRYFYGGNDNSWLDCLDGVSGTKSDLTAHLEKAYAPYWANTYNDYTIDDVPAGGVYNDDDGLGDYVWTCKQSGTKHADCPGGGGAYEASLANTEREECDDQGSTLNCYRSSGNWPCGCGPNMRWCQLWKDFTTTSSLALSTADKQGFYRIADQTEMEAHRFVAEVVKRENGLLGDVPFTEIFRSDKVVRTSRLQHFYELNQTNWKDTNEPDQCYRLIEGVSNDADPSDGTLACTATIDGTTPRIPFVDRLYDANPSVYYDDGHLTDWQAIDLAAVADSAGGNPLEYHGAGILSTWQILNRQPSEPNFANRVYSFWTCEEVTWRGDLSAWTVTIDGGGSGTHILSTPVATSDFSELEFTDAAEDALSNSDCFGCHMTVNSVAAFRNEWNSAARYKPTDVEAKGAFLGVSGEGLNGLGDILKDNNVVDTCIVNRSVELLTGARLNPDDETLHQLRLGFVSSGRDIRELYKDIIGKDIYRRAK